MLFHSGLTLFNLIGWVNPQWRRLHFYTITITIVSWLLIGWWVGQIGYCPLTDWHWDVKRMLGETNLPGSCIKYYVDKVFMYEFNAVFVDIMTAVFGIVALSISLYYRWKNDPSESKS